MKDIFSLTTQIDQAFCDHFQNDPNVVSIFVVGSMYDMHTYKLRQNNDYDIRLLVKTVTPQLLIEVDAFQKQLIADLSSEDFAISSNNLVGLVNHKVSTEKTSLLLHLLIHTISDLDAFLPATHQYCYSHFYRMVSGDDYLEHLKDITFEPSYLIDCHEGIDYCCDMLARNVYKYLEWTAVSETHAEFIYNEKPVTEDLICESVFYSLKNIFRNLYHASENHSDPSKEMDYILQTFAPYNMDTTLIHAVYQRDEDCLTTYGDRLFEQAIQLMTCIKSLILEEKL